MQLRLDENARTEQHGKPHGDVYEEDPAPSERAGQNAAEQESCNDSQGGHAAVDAHRPVPLSPFRKGRGDQRKSIGSRERRADALQPAKRDKGGPALGQAGEERGKGEHRHPDLKQPSPPEKIPEASAEQKQAAKGEDVGVDDPWEIGRGNAEFVLDRRQGDVGNGIVEHQHELSCSDDGEGQAEPGPGTAYPCGRSGIHWKLLGRDEMRAAQPSAAWDRSERIGQSGLWSPEQASTRPASVPRMASSSAILRSISRRCSSAMRLTSALARSSSS